MYYTGIGRSIVWRAQQKNLYDGGMVLSIVQQHTNTKVHKYTLIHSDAYIIAGTRTLSTLHEYRGHINKRPPKNQKPQTIQSSGLVVNGAVVLKMGD